MIYLISTSNNLLKDSIYSDFLLIVNYKQDAQRKELLIAPFADRNKMFKHCIFTEFLLIES